MQRGRLRCDAGEGAPAVEAFTRALAATSDPVERCRALLGLAAGHRLIANVDEALAMLAEAEPIATRHGLTRELAELHATRGNVQFARGDNAACRAAHEAGAVHARALGDPALIARALSGLADAHYATSRMRTALARFDECVALCEAHGLARIAIPNLVMGGFCRMYMSEFDAGIEKMRAGHALARRVGDRHSEMFGLEALGVLLAFRGHYVEAEPVCSRALALAESLGARRYQALLLCVLAETRFMQGDLEGARERNARALVLARETGMPFCGPLVLALAARMLEAGPERERCRDEVLAMLGQAGPRPQPDRIPPPRHRRRARARRMGPGARARRHARGPHPRRAAPLRRLPDRARALPRRARRESGRTGRARRGRTTQVRGRAARLAGPLARLCRSLTRATRHGAVTRRRDSVTRL